VVRGNFVASIDGTARLRVGLDDDSSGTDSACGACQCEPVLLASQSVGNGTIRPARPVPGQPSHFLLGSVGSINWGSDRLAWNLDRFHKPWQ